MLARRLLHAVVKRDQRPIDRPINMPHRMWNATGPLTAFEAYDMVERLVMRHDPEARLTAMHVEKPLDARGRSTMWRLRMFLPVRRAIASYNVVAPTSHENGPRPVDIDEHIAPNDAGDSISHALPVPFLDSPAIVAVVGDACTTVETCFDANGLARWRIVDAHGHVREIPLAA